jgi:asparagine synthase (glutamine-hydrolysing)
MSGLLAIVDSSERPIEPAVVDRMMRAQGYRGDRIGSWTDGRGALLAQCDADAVAGSSRLQRPASDDGRVQIVFDGRLDNRDELVPALTAAGRAPRGTTDAELALRAYQAWGDACASRLAGDFAFVVWDACERTLFAARDILGLRPLYYRSRGPLLLLASEIAALLQHPAISATPNDGFVAECLAGQIRHPCDTVWHGVSRLRPAHVLVARDGGVRVRRYWQPDARAEIRYRDDAEYAEQLSELLCRATRARVPRDQPFGLMLSGGLDSSAVLGALHDLRTAAPGPIRTYSLVEPGERWDESEYLDAAIARWPVNARRLAPSVPAPQTFAGQAEAFRDVPNYPGAVMAHSLFAAAGADGVRVLLTGIWSDEWFTGSPLYYADLLNRLHLVSLWRHARAQSGDDDAFRPPSLFRAAVWPLVPEPARRAIKRALGRDGVPDWIDRRLAAEVDLPSRLRPPSPEICFATRARTETFALATSAACVHAAEWEHRGAAAWGIDTRHPFADRRIVDLALALPEDLLWRGPRTKVVLRHAARPWLPAAHQRRITSANAGSVVLDAIRRTLDCQPMAALAVARRGWIDAAALERRYRATIARYNAGDSSFAAMTSPLWLVCAVEIWAREQERGIKAA